MTGPTVYKMTGSGNDFVLFDGREIALADWPGARIAAICDRRNGVGADGLVILTPETPGTVRMAFFNSDGSRAAMCGNAALCSTRLSARLGLAPADGMCLATDAGLVRTRCVGDDGDDAAEIQLPPVELPAPVAGIELGAGEREILFTVVGVPHLVVRVGDIEAIDLMGRGRELRYHPALGSAGANVNFVAPPARPGAPWPIRTYERGVEGETLACGTGTVAAALALAVRGDLSLPATFLTRNGTPLGVRAEIRPVQGGPGLAEEVWLAGQGRLVFTAALAG